MNCVQVPLVKAAILGAAATLAIGFFPSAASAQCTLTVLAARDVSEVGSPGVDAGTDENCGHISSQTEVWIGNAPAIICSWGQEAGTVCYNFSNGPGSYALGFWTGYGVWRGYSKHFSISDATGEWQQVGLVRYTYLNAGQAANDTNCQEWETWDQQTQSCVGQNTPILIPMTRAQGIRLTSATEGVRFDMDGDGALEQTAWTERKARVAFLAIDRNGNGRIDSGRELFGNNTVPGSPNGFEALQALNMQLNGGQLRASINHDEPLFAKLLLWEDANHNGVSEPHEIQPAAPLLSDVGLGYSEHKRKDGHGNLFLFRGWASVRTAPGRNEAVEPGEQQARRVNIYDVVFVMK